VIGETAVVGRNCSFLHGVTLGSTGKDTGDRHPKIGDDVLIGCNAMVLGNITIGRSSKIGSGSVVIKSIPCNVTAVGNPARIIGRTAEGTSAAAEMDLALKNVIAPCGTLFRSTWALWADGSLVFEDVDADGKGYVDKEDIRRFLAVKYHHSISDGCVDMLFSKLDPEARATGKILRPAFENMMATLRPVFGKDGNGEQKLSDAEESVAEGSSFGASPASPVGKSGMDDVMTRLSILRGEGDIDAILTNYFSKIAETIPIDGYSI